MMWMVSLTLQMKIHLQTSALANELWCSVKRTLVVHYVAYNALHVIYHDTISCNIFKLRCLCVISEQTAII